MPCDVEIRAIPGSAPIEKQASAAHLRDRSGKRNLIIEIEYVGRIDQRRDKDCARTFAAMIAQHCRPDLRDNRKRGTRSRPRRILVFRQSVERRARGLGIPLADHPYHFEK